MGAIGHISLGGAICLALSEHALASAWNPEAWRGEIISGYVMTSADEAVDRFGNRVELDIYSKQIVQNYGNVGLTDRIALIGTFDWQDTQLVGPSLETSFSEPSSISAGLQYQLHAGEGRAIAMSVSYVEGIDLPVALLTLENREDSLELRGLWGESRAWKGMNVFGELQLAGQMTLGGDYAATRSQATLGIEPTERTMILAKLRYVNIEPGLFERLEINRQTRWETEASAVYRLWNENYVEFGYTGVIDAQNAVLERGWKLGFWTKF